MLKAADEIGGKPFILFQYYKTWETASEGIKPSLQRVAADLGLKTNAVCNLRAKLIEKGWIRFENEEVFIIKTFTENESKPKPKPSPNHSQKMNEKTFTENESDTLKLEIDSQKMNADSQKMNEPFTKNERTFTKNESPYKEEKEQEKEQLERTGEKEKNIKKENLPFDLLVDKFPSESFTSAHGGFVAETVTDSEIDKKAWLNTLTIYEQNYDPMRNRYIPTKIANVLNVFRSEKEKLKKQAGVKNGNIGNYKQSSTIGSAQAVERAEAIIADRQRFESPKLN